jgi:SSS family solute:Na+ symporter
MSHADPATLPPGVEATPAASVNATALAVFIALFVLVTGVGFVASRWRQGDLDHLHEWGLGGRRFGTVVTWFLLGGDLYTAYTFMAVPALVYGAGAFGFFAVPYTTIAYPFVFVVMPRLWSVSHKHGYITGADFVRGRFDSGALALAVAVTGMLATMPYIALQLVGIQVVLGAMGVGGEWPLVIAFLILAAYTYQSGLRAPALIAVVKDVIIYVTVIAAVIVIPSKLGGYAKIFDAVPPPKLLLTPPKPGDLGQESAYATVALGSALALFLYPHSLTGVLSSSDRTVIRRNAAMLPAYSVLLALIALLGYMALAAGVGKDPAYAAGFKQYGPNFAVPALFLGAFSPWFAGFSFAAIAIGALVPAAIMSIAAANLFTRNVYREYLRPGCDHKEESTVAKVVSLVVKLGALAFIVGLPQKYAIQLQLLGGVWVLQTFPAIVGGLYTRWPHRAALLAGWASGMATGTWMAWKLDFKGTVYPLHLPGLTVPGYAALWAFGVNVLVVVLGTAALRAAGVDAGEDATSSEDYGGA